MIASLLARANLTGGRPIDLGALTGHLAAAYGERAAVVIDPGASALTAGDRWTYQALEDDVARLAAAHRSQGLGARVALVMSNRIDLLLHLLALRRTGATVVPIDARTDPATLGRLLDVALPDAVLVDEDVAGRLAGLTEVRRVTWSRASFEAWKAANPEARLSSPDLDPDEPALLLATSGTTGTPKLARLTSHGLLSVPRWFAALPVGHARGVRAGRDVLLEALPLSHVMGLVSALCALCAGITLRHVARFDAGEVLDRIERERPNLFCGVPTMYADLEAAGAARRDLKSVQAWIGAADEMPADRARRFQGYGAIASWRGLAVGSAAFVDGYGLVESSGPAALRLYAPAVAGRVRPRTMWVLLPGYEARAVGEDGRVVRPGRPGRLHLRGPGRMAGYAGRDGGLTDDGWVVTDDIVRVRLGRFLTWVGRTRDRLKVGGFSVFPAEVEAALLEHPGVREVVVAGVKDERAGDRLVALVVPSGPDTKPADVLAWAQERIGGYRCPRAVHLVEAVPRGGNGKVDRTAAARLADDLEAR